MLYVDQPARLDPLSLGTHAFPETVGATYTVGRDHVKLALAELFRRTRHVAVDIETYGKGKDGLRIKSVTFGSATTAVVLDPRDPYQEALIKDAIGWAKELIVHNGVFDVPNLYRNGLMRIADIGKITDTVIYGRLALPDEKKSKGLLDACNRWIGTTGKDQLSGIFRALGLSKTEGFKRFDLDRPVYLQGAASDPIATARLLPAVRQAAYANLTTGHPFSIGLTGDAAWELVEREQIINRMLLRRACRGIKVNLDYLDGYLLRNEAEILATEAMLNELGIRPGVSADLGRWLEAEGLLPADFPRTEKTRQPQITEKTVGRLGSEVADSFIAHKKIKRVRSDYLEKLAGLADDENRIHPEVNLLVAATGRMSYGNPPLQQFNEDARGMIEADDGDSLTSLDWAQIEPITMALTARDTRVIAGYEGGSDDLYTDLAVYAGLLPPGTTKAIAEASPATKKIRSAFKVVVLAQMYGEGMAKLSRDLGYEPGPLVPDWRDPQKLVPSYPDAERIRDQVMATMPRSAQLIKRLKAIAREHKKIITLSGRILPIPFGEYDGRWGVQAHKGVNFYCQGSAYDVLAEALVGVERAGLGDAVYLAMHDECVVSTSAAHDIERIMQRPPERLVEIAGRHITLKTDREDLGKAWKK